MVDAATELFTDKGWGATGVRDIAAAAGVSVETVYAHFASKKGVLQAVADQAAAGDDVPVALAERTEFRRIGRGRRADRLAAAAAFLTGVQIRTSVIARLLRQAAAGDADIADLLRTTRERQRADVGAAFALMVGREPSAEERDGLWALSSPEVYLLLVEESGWTPEQYEAWIAETLGRVIPRS